MGLFSPQLSTRQMCSICGRLETAISAGIPILKVCELMGESSSSVAVRRIFRPIAASIREGADLTKAFKPQEKYLSRLFVATIGAGDRAGQLHRIMPSLLAHYEYRLEIIRAIVRHGLYLLLIIALIIIIIPFGSALASAHFFDGSVSEVAISFLLVYGVAFLKLILFVLVIRTALTWMPLRIVLSYSLDWVIPLGTLLRKFALARYLYSLGLMLESGMSNKNAHLSAIPSAANYPLENRLTSLTLALDAGAPLGQALRTTRLLRDDLVATLEMGEHSGRLEYTLYDVSRILMNESKNPIVVGISVLEAVAICLLYLSYLPF